MYFHFRRTVPFLLVLFSAEMVLAFEAQNIHGVDLPEKYLSLTIDDGPSSRTQEFWDLFAREKIPATFFLFGWMVEKYPYAARAIQDRGHLVANHS